MYDLNSPAAQSPLDLVTGSNLKQVLGDVDLEAGAANAYHTEKMTEAGRFISSVEALPQKLSSFALCNKKKIFDLYKWCFPDPDERELVPEIKNRIKEGTDHFHAHVFVKGNQPVAYAQSSVLESDQGSFVYWQYGCVADETFMKDTCGVEMNPRQKGIMNLMHGVNTATLYACTKKSGQTPIGTLWESEPRGLGTDQESIRFTEKRLKIHQRAGGRVLMGKAPQGKLVNLHLQPQLTDDSSPIALHFLYRPAKYNHGDQDQSAVIPGEMATELVKSFIDNFRKEGFQEHHVAAAEKEIQERLDLCTSFVLLPADQVPDVMELAETDDRLKAQVLETYGVDSLREAKRIYNDAISP